MTLNRDTIDKRNRKIRQLSKMDSFQVFLLLTTLLSTTSQVVVDAVETNAVKEVTLVKASEEKPPSKLIDPVITKDVKFPTPQVENVYKEWKPVDFGHPLRDETLYYAPPSLERVHLDGRSSSSAESRSLTNDGEEKKSRDELFPVVIAAEPRKDPKEHAYSVYGSPSIDYSKLYSLPGVKLATHSEPLDDGRDAPYLAFQRDYFNSASASRSADPIEFPSNHEPRSRSDTLGGIRYIDPPNRQPQQTSYFYYSEDSPYYKERLAEKTAPIPIANKPVQEAVEETVDILPKPSVKKPLQAQSRKFDDSSEIQSGKQQTSGHVNAVVYSYKNEYGQNTKVGVVLDDDDLTPAESLVSHAPGDKSAAGSNPPLGGPQESAEPVKIIPLTHGQKNLPGILQGNQGAASVYPLGAPYRLPERPKFFPAQDHPPIFKTRPNHLEGTFGPALPPKPSPDTIEFPDEHEYSRPRPQSVPQKAARRHDVEYDDVDLNTYVYATDREMEYRRPAVILQVGDSNELYKPDEADDRIWKPDFTDALEDQRLVQQTERPFEFQQPQPQQQQQQPIQRVGQQQFPFDQVASIDQQKLAVHHDQNLNNRGNGENAKRALVLFPDDKKSSGLVRPFRAVSSQPANRNQAAEVATGVAPKGPVPNYRTVIGASYDDLPSAPKTIDDDFEDIEDKTTQNKSNDDKRTEDKKSGDKKYTKQELFDLCVKEVPDYLRFDLCGSLLESKSTAEKRVDIVPAPAKNAALPVQSQPLPVSNPKPKIEAVPKEVVTEKSTTLKPEINNNNFLGIPLELPVEVKRKGQHEVEPEVENAPAAAFLVYRTSDSPLQAETQFSGEEDTTVRFSGTGDSEEGNIDFAPSVQVSQPEVPQRPVVPPSPSSPRPDARSESRHPPGYLSRLMQFFGGSAKPGPQQQQPQPQQRQQLRRRINA